MAIGVGVTVAVFTPEAYPPREAKQPILSGSLSEIPGFQEYYLKKHNLTTMLSSAYKFSLKRDICRTTSMDSIYPAGSAFYHGTPVNFSGYPFAPSWFATELPPKNRLAVHVPMAWMCFGKGGYSVPGKFWLKEFKLRDEQDFPEEVDAETFYNNLGNQNGEAKEFCRCNDGSKAGFIIDEDAVDREPETVLCDPERVLEYVTQHEGHTSWAPNGNTLRLDVGAYGKYSLNCHDPMGSFSVMTPPSLKDEPDKPSDGPDCCSCCPAATSQRHGSATSSLIVWPEAWRATRSSWTDMPQGPVALAECPPPPEVQECGYNPNMCPFDILSKISSYVGDPVNGCSSSVKEMMVPMLEGVMSDKGFEPSTTCDTCINSKSGEWASCKDAGQEPHDVFFGCAP